jgi:hypothetical protein
MKKTIVTILSFFIFLLSKAQVAEFLSLQSATSAKDSKGNFVQVREWIGQEMYIKFDIGRGKVQFFSKGMLDRDTFSLKKEILISNRSASPGIIDEEMIRGFFGIDRSGKRCTVRLKLTKDEYKMLDGQLRVEYQDSAEIYKIRTLKHNPTFNKS